MSFAPSFERCPLDFCRSPCYSVDSPFMGWALHERQAVSYTTRKGVLLMRITLHIGRFTVTIIVKSRNRHSAK